MLICAGSMQGSSLFSPMVHVHFGVFHIFLLVCALWVQAWKALGIQVVPIGKLNVVPFCVIVSLRTDGFRDQCPSVHYMFQLARFHRYLVDLSAHAHFPRQRSGSMERQQTLQLKARLDTVGHLKLGKLF